MTTTMTMTMMMTMMMMMMMMDNSLLSCTPVSTYSRVLSVVISSYFNANNFIVAKTSFFQIP